MKSRIIYCFVLMSLPSCSFLFDGDNYNKEGYRDGSGSGSLINKGSIIGSWEQTYRWESFNSDFPSYEWIPTNINYGYNYVFLEDGTFTSTNDIYECTGTNGTYIIEGSKITLKYICETEPEVTKEELIDEFFFRENYIVFIKGDGYDNISKLELVKEN